MKKLSIILALSVLLSGMPSAFVRAASVKAIVPNSTFDADSKGWSGGTLADGDAVKKKGNSYKTTFSTGNYAEFQLSDNGMVPGMAYEVSFYAKADKDGIRFQPIRIHGSGGWTYLQTVTLTTSWEKYTMQFTHPAASQQGNEVDGTGKMFFRVLDKGSVWLDEVYIQDPNALIDDGTDEYKGEIYEPYVYESEGRKVDMSGFSDTVGHWAERTAVIMKAEGIINGMGDGTYQPDRGITRAEFLKLLMVGFNLEDSSYEGMYSDVSGDAWYSGMVQNAYELGIISPVLTSDGGFHPDEAISREDAAALAAGYAEFMGYADVTSDISFADDYAISPLAKESVYSAARKNIITGLPGGIFNPRGGLTRAEAAQIMKNLIEKNGILAIFVDSENGKDTNPGTEALPVKTIDKAQKLVRENNTDMKHNIYVFIKSGEIFVDKTIELTPADAGSGMYSVIYTSYGGGQAVLSGGKHFKGGWQTDDAEKGIYKLYVGSDIKTRQMFVDDIRMTRARTEGGFETATLITDDKLGYVTSDTYFKDYRNPDDLELVYYVQWTNPRCGVSDLTDNGDGTITLTMDQPCWNYLMNKQHLVVSLPDHFENQYEFIDDPGEWYLDDEGWLYFKPYDFQNLNEAEIVLPVTEQFINVTGSKENRVENLALINLGFKYATWMRPSTGNGYTDAQGGRLRENGGDHVPDSSVWVKYANNLTIKDCTFSKLGITALNVTDWIENASISGNHMYDLSAAGMYIGNHGVLGGASGNDYISKNILVENNYVHDYGIDYGSSDGIEGMTMQYATVRNNEIYKGRYSGLVLGYGASGSRYAIDYVHNYIHDVLYENIYDGGAVYVTGATDGDEDRRNTIAYNYCVNQGNHFGIFYLDNNTTWWDVSNNVADQRRSPLWYGYKRKTGENISILFSNGKEHNKCHSNYSTHDAFKMSGTFWVDGVPDTDIGENYIYEDGNWPAEALDIIAQSGLNAEYEAKYPAGIQVIDASVRENAVLRKNETADIFEMFKIKAYGRKNVELPIDRSSFKFYTNDNDIISVSEDGYVTSIGTGIAKLDILVFVGDILYKYTGIINSGDEFGKASLNTNNITVYEGRSYKLVPSVVSKLGAELMIKSVSYSSANEAVAKVSEDGTVTGTGIGETTVTAAIESDETVVFEIPVTVKKKPDGKGFNVNDYMVYDFSDAVRSTDSWLTGSDGDTVVKEGTGIRILTPSVTAGQNQQFTDELLHMKLKINASGGWPSISLRSDTQTGSYGKATQYMVTFGAGNLSIQKFVKGERRTYENANFPCSFEYGKEYDLLIGAINHDDSVEVIVCLDGEPVMRFHDYDETRITEQGHVQVYCRAGSIELMPVD